MLRRFAFFLLFISTPTFAGIAFYFPGNFCPGEIADTVVPFWLRGRLTATQRLAMRQIPLLRDRLEPDVDFQAAAVSMIESESPVVRLRAMLEERIDRHERQFEGGIYESFVEDPDRITYDDIRSRQNIAWYGFQLLQDEIVFFRSLKKDEKLPRFNSRQRFEYFQKTWRDLIPWTNSVLKKTSEPLTLRLLFGFEMTNTLELAQILAVSKRIPENYRAVLRSYLWTLSYHKLRPTNLFLHFCEALDQLELPE